MRRSQVGLRVFFGRPGQWFEENDLDGDKNSIFHDVDGSVTGYADTYVGRADNLLIQHPGCVSMPQWSGVVCSGRYSQVRVSTCCVASATCRADTLTQPLLPPPGVYSDPGSPQPHSVHLSGRISKLSAGAEGDQQPGGALSTVPACPDDEQELHSALERTCTQRSCPLPHQL